MPKLNEKDPTKHIKVLVMGHSGVGKTVFACGFPGPIHVLDFDNKVSSAAAFYRGSSQIDQITYENYAPVDVKGSSLKRANEDLDRMKSSGEFPKTLVIDSLTTFSDEVMRYLIGINPGIKRHTTRGSQLPVLQDYQVARQFIKEFISTVLNFSCNIVFTAHIDISKDETTGQILYTPMMAGKLSKELPIFFPEVYRAYVDGKGNRLIQTSKDRHFDCRTELSIPDGTKLDYESLIQTAKPTGGK